jgi:hypothetical protein
MTVWIYGDFTKQVGNKDHLQGSSESIASGGAAGRHPLGSLVGGLLRSPPMAAQLASGSAQHLNFLEPLHGSSITA